MAPRGTRPGGGAACPRFGAPAEAPPGACCTAHAVVRPRRRPTFLISHGRWRRFLYNAGCGALLSCEELVTNQDDLMLPPTEPEPRVAEQTSTPQRCLWCTGVPVCTESSCQDGSQHCAGLCQGQWTPPIHRSCHPAVSATLTTQTGLKQGSNLGCVLSPPWSLL